MSKLKSPDNWKQQVVNLNDDELKHPYQVLDDFFNAFQIQEARAELWQWLVAALGNECGDYDDGKSRSNLIAFYEILESLVEAAWIIDQNHKAKKGN